MPTYTAEIPVSNSAFFSGSRQIGSRFSWVARGRKNGEEMMIPGYYPAQRRQRKSRANPWAARGWKHRAVCAIIMGATDSMLFREYAAYEM
jgi:hypothetical protein